MNKFSKAVFITLLFYISLPILIFITGWVKSFIAIPTVMVVLFCLYRIANKQNFIFNIPMVDKQAIERLIIIFLIIVFWVYFSGIGKFVYQNGDHVYRNAIFEMLVNNDWPIIKKFSVNNNSTAFMFVYYIGFWLPAAVVGKIFGITAGYCFQLIWATVGIWLFYYLCSCYFSKVSIKPLICFVFFSGLDMLGTAILSGSSVDVFADNHLEWWANSMQFSSFTTQLFWVFNQAIPAWILTMILLMQKNNRYIVFLLGLHLIFCPLPFIGILSFCIYIIIRNIRERLKVSDIKEVVKDLFSVENILGGGLTGIITYLYYKTNSSGQHISLVPAIANGKKGLFFIIVLFIFLEIGIYIIAIYKYQKCNPLLYISFCFLCTCPFIQIGYGDDYCMRACIPSQIVLYLLVMDSLYKAKKDKSLGTYYFIIGVLIIGAITPIHEFNRTIKNTYDNYQNGDPVYAATYTEEELMTGRWGTNFRGEVEGSFFVKYIAK